MTRPVPAALVTGQPLTRVDGRLRVTGQARYAADNSLPNLAYAALVCSTVARGTVEHIDSAATQRNPDVVRVITDFGGVKLPYDPRQIASFGQPVAVVVANTLEAATHAASLVEVRYSDAPSLTDMDSPQAVWEPSEDEEMQDYARGDAANALRAAAVVSDLQYSIARNNHNSMELPATVASWDGDRLTVWDKASAIRNAVTAYTTAFGIPADQIRVIAPFVGGAFGSAGRPRPTSC